ncbi:hypothetical protein KEM55_002848 [Ascosphaera atra]|nr:hypothetical protein KEM55_002848 [Ascosphaera atra]
MSRLLAPAQPKPAIMPSRMPLSKRLAEYPPQRENGRKYHGYRKGLYMYPCDEAELDRLDFLHRLLIDARRGTMHDAPLRLKSPKTVAPMEPAARIMDLGCGTGVWCMEMAEAHPTSLLLGVDLTATQPEVKPQNCDFLPYSDYEDPLFLGDDSWDLIRLQMGSGSVKSWENLFRKVFRHVRSGTGFYEQVELDFEPRWDAADIGHPGFTPDQPLGAWWQAVDKATKIAKRPLAHDRNTAHMLKTAGFVDVDHHIIGIPFNQWPEVAHDAHIGRLYNACLRDTFYTLALGPLTRIFGWTPDQVRHLSEQAYLQASDIRCRGFNLLHIYTARKPSPHDG